MFMLLFWGALGLLNAFVGGHWTITVGFMVLMACAAHSKAVMDAAIEAERREAELRTKECDRTHPPGSYEDRYYDRLADKIARQDIH